MKQFFPVAAIAVCLLFTTNANAKIFRVGYNGPQKSGVDYNDLQIAADSCSNNSAKPDTIYLFPGDWSASYNKKIVTIGYGYYVDTALLGTAANKGLQNIVGEITVLVLISDESAGSVFEGIDGLSISAGFATAHDITVERCSVYIGNSFNTLSDFNIFQSVLSFNATNQASLVRVLISNCIINQFLDSYITGQSGLIQNCIFTDNWDDPGFIFENNVFLYDAGSATSTSTYNYNVFAASKPSGLKGGNNKYNVKQDSIFVGYSKQKQYSNDSKWVLKTNSAAEGAGRNGIDCGIYATGSNYPYKPSGIPAIPAFYRLDAPSTTTDSLGTFKITFSVRSNN